MPQFQRNPAGQLKPPVEKPSIERLFEDEESPLLGFAYGFVRRREIAEDLVQEAFFRIHRHWETVEKPRAWIYRATRNLCLSWIRDHKRETEMDDERQQNTPDPNAEQPDKALAKLESVGTLRALLAELDETDRELVRLKYSEGLRYKQISEQTGLSVSNVGYKLHHILRGLAGSLKQTGIHNSGT